MLVAFLPHKPHFSLLHIQLNSQWEVKLGCVAFSVQNWDPAEFSNHSWHLSPLLYFFSDSAPRPCPPGSPAPCRMLGQRPKHTLRGNPLRVCPWVTISRFSPPLVSPLLPETTKLLGSAGAWVQGHPWESVSEISVTGMWVKRLAGVSR